MSRAANSIYVFGIYLFLLACALIVTPNAVLVWIGLPPMSGATGSVLGTLIVILGCLCVRAARTDWMAFFRWSVHSRCGVAVTLGTFVLLGLAPPALLLFGALDFLGAVWTAYAFRSVSDRHTFHIGCHGAGIL
jgi:hypothetical protein